MNDQNVFYSTDEFPQAILASWAPILENRANCPRSARIIAHHRPESPPTIIQNDCPRWARIRSRCRGWCLLSLVERGEIGVDIETLPVQPETAGVSGEILSASETAWLEKQESDGAIAFLQCWTRKEAILKQKGTGLFGDLREVETEPQLESGEVLKNAPTTRIWTFRTSYPNAVCAMAVGHDVVDLSVSMFSPPG